MKTKPMSFDFTPPPKNKKKTKKNTLPINLKKKQKMEGVIPQRHTNNHPIIPKKNGVVHPRL